MKSDTVQDIARTLYEVLTRTALDQLDAVAQKVQGIKKQDASLQKHIEAALPADALPQVRNFLHSLANEGILDQLPQIIEAFEHLIARESQIVNAEVVSAVALESAQQERIASELQQQYGVDSDYLHFKVDETLIGGLIIRIGDKVFDNSLRARLGSVQRSMMMS